MEEMINKADSLTLRPNVFIHREINIENFLLPNGDPDGKIALIDFDEDIFGDPLLHMVSLYRHMQLPEQISS